jgi:hypothetical protein
LPAASFYGVKLNESNVYYQLERNGEEAVMNLFQGTVPTFAWTAEGKSQDSQCHG